MLLTPQVLRPRFHINLDKTCKFVEQIGDTHNLLTPQVLRPRFHINLDKTCEFVAQGLMGVLKYDFGI